MSGHCKNYNWAGIVILTMATYVAQSFQVAMAAIGAGSVTSCRELVDACAV